MVHIQFPKYVGWSLPDCLNLISGILFSESKHLSFKYFKQKFSDASTDWNQFHFLTTQG